MQRAEYKRDYRARNREKLRRRAVEYRLANHDAVLERQRCYRAHNREKLKAQSKEWRERNHHKIRTAELAHAGFTVESFEATIAAQGNCCAICNSPFDQSIAGKACADHCHITGEPRGVICCTCNLGLGHFKDDPERLCAAIAYLARFA